MPKFARMETTATTEMIGKQFLDYYERLGYETIPGSSLIDNSVPMSFVMSAGMVQFEKLADKGRSGDHFCLIQNCFRYFDLEKIGSSKTHLSLFQMPGAFDFGKLNRSKTISQIWRLLTEVYGLDPDDLVVTYFVGDVIDGQKMPADIETKSAWLATGLPAKRIIGLPASSNFWIQTSQAVGENNSRKRGPNTEVFFDRGLEHACSKNCGPGCSCGRYIEFLNTLFISYMLDETKHQLADLEEPFTEVVVGLERVAQIIQGKASVFEIDSIQPLILQLRSFSKPLPIHNLDIEKFERILTDHIRALLFLTVDGAPPPGKGGRARLMRILIRELLTSQRLLGISDVGFMQSMMVSTINLYPQLASGKKRLLEFIGTESERFRRTVYSGMRKLEKVLNEKKRELNADEMETFEKKLGLPIPLLQYQLWQKNVKRQ